MVVMLARRALLPHTSNTAKQSKAPSLDSLLAHDEQACPCVRVCLLCFIFSFWAVLLFHGTDDSFCLICMSTTHGRKRLSLRTRSTSTTRTTPRYSTPIYTHRICYAFHLLLATRPAEVRRFTSASEPVNEFALYVQATHFCSAYVVAHRNIHTHTHKHTHRVRVADVYDSHHQPRDATHPYAIGRRFTFALFIREV